MIGWHNPGFSDVFSVLTLSRSLLSSGGVSFFLAFASISISTTCQVGHFESHFFWFLIEFLVLTGGRYILHCLSASANGEGCILTYSVIFSNVIFQFFLESYCFKLQETNVAFLPFWEIKFNFAKNSVHSFQASLKFLLRGGSTLASPTSEVKNILK